MDKYDIPGLGEISIRSITRRKLLQIESDALETTEAEQAYKFTRSLIAALLDTPSVAEDEIVCWPEPVMKELIRILVNMFEIGDRYEATEDELKPEERFFQAYAEWSLLPNRSEAIYSENGLYGIAEAIRNVPSLDIVMPDMNSMAATANLLAHLNGGLQTFQITLGHELASLVRNFTNPIAEEINKLQENIGVFYVSALNGLTALTHPFAGLEEKIREMQEGDKTISDEIGPLLQSASFWMSPSLPYGIIPELVQLKNKGNVAPNLVVEVIVAACEAENFSVLRYMVEHWENNSHFKGRMHIIRDALDAHIAGKYTLSIPALLPLVEGILIEMVGERKSQNMGEWLKKAFDNFCDGYWAASERDAVVAYLESQRGYGKVGDYMRSDLFPVLLEKEGYEARNVLNRHAIMHGVHLNYDSKENSLRVFMILDVISEFTQSQITQ